MEMRPISGQDPDGLIEYFSALGADRIIALIRYLELEVDGPSQWVTTRLAGFHLGSTDHWDPWRARVFVDTLDGGFLIRYRSAPEKDWERSFTEIPASTVAEAGRAVQEALQRALPDPPGRFL